MAVHWVNYDLNNSGKDYQGLIAYLKSHDSWAKPLKSSFFVKTSMTAGQLRDGIQALIDSDDQVVVVNVTGDGWATQGIAKTVTNWIRANM